MNHRKTIVYDGVAEWPSSPSRYAVVDVSVHPFVVFRRFLKKTAGGPVGGEKG